MSFLLTNTTILLGALALYSRIWNNYMNRGGVYKWQNYSERSLFIRESGTIVEPWRCVQMAKLLGALALYSRIWNNCRTVAVCTNGKITRSARSLFENLEQL